MKIISQSVIEKKKFRPKNLYNLYLVLVFYKGNKESTEDMYTIMQWYLMLNWNLHRRMHTLVFLGGLITEVTDV